jgi:hemoglobin
MNSTSRPRGARTPAEGAPTAALDAQRATYSSESIDLMVETFYGRVRADLLLGPVFERRITDWPSHLARMRAFWRSVLRAESGYHAERGSPLQIHAAMPELTREHYARWLVLFERAATEVFDPAAAAGVVRRAERMAATLGRSQP